MLRNAYHKLFNRTIKIERNRSYEHKPHFILTFDAPFFKYLRRPACVSVDVVESGVVSWHRLRDLQNETRNVQSRNDKEVG